MLCQVMTYNKSSIQGECLMTTTGARLKECREYLKLSQDDIAKLIGSTPSYISLVENNRSKLSTDNLIKLLLRYNINLNYLLAGIGKPFNTINCENQKDKIIKNIFRMITKYMNENNIHDDFLIS